MLISILTLSFFSGCLERDDKNLVQVSGEITDKWSAIVKAGFGSKEAFFFEMDNIIEVEVSRFDYHNYEIGDSYNWMQEEK
jgi:hypothetical protein